MLLKHFITLYKNTFLLQNKTTLFATNFDDRFIPTVTSTYEQSVATNRASQINKLEQ